MSESRRVQRVEKEIQHIVANYLVRGFKGRLRGLVSVSRVESNPKLRTAKVFVTVLGSDEDQESSLQTLQDYIYDIQKQVNQSLQMKFVPRLSIVQDLGMEKVLRVEALLREVALQSRDKEQNETKQNLSPAKVNSEEE